MSNETTYLKSGNLWTFTWRGKQSRLVFETLEAVVAHVERLSPTWKE